jgi:hypothetical protein
MSSDLATSGAWFVGGLFCLMFLISIGILVEACVRGYIKTRCQKNGDYQQISIDMPEEKHYEMQ